MLTTFGELAVQVGGGDVGQLVGRDGVTVGSGSLEGVRGVEDEQDSMPQVAAAPRRRLAAVVVGDAADHSGVHGGTPFFSCS